MGLFSKIKQMFKEPKVQESDISTQKKEQNVEKIN